MRKKKTRRMMRSIGSLILSGTLISICLIIAFSALSKVKAETNMEVTLARWETYQEEQAQKEEENKSSSETSVTITEKQSLNDGIHTTSEKQTRNEMEDLMKKISNETAGSDPR